MDEIRGVYRPCHSCGSPINISVEDCLVISTSNDTHYYCKACLFSNPSFRRLAGAYVMQKAEELFTKEA